MTNIEIAREVVETCSFNKKEGLDLFSAGHYCAVYDALCIENRAKLEAMPLHAAVILCFKVTK